MFEIHPAASEEASAARDWYDDRSDQAANQFESDLRTAFDRIVESPTSWPKGLHGTRSLKLDRFPYLVVYRHRSEDVLVVAVAHASRRPGYWKTLLNP